ncbi:serine hydrolase FSH [Trichoderma sp. SZMC 28014]
MSREDLSLPRILCLHGASVNAQVFRIQCRAIISSLKDTFRFVFPDAPYEAPADEAVVAVFGEFAPFYRWLRWKPEHQDIDPVEASTAIISQIKKAMAEDRGTGEWVGLLAFSQGGIIAGNLLWSQEHIADEALRPLPGVNFRFAVVMAAPAPVVFLDESGKLPKPRHMPYANERMDHFSDWPEEGVDGEHLIRAPILHVHGLQDGNLVNHRRLYKLYSKKGTAKLMEWNGGHRLPIQTSDVERLVNGIRAIAESVGIEAYDDVWC